MPAPDVQIVTIVGARSPAFEWDRIEAIEFAFGPSDDVSPESLIDALIDLVRPAPFSLDERYGKFSWGAAGPDIQTLLIITAAGGAAGALARDAIIAGLQALTRRARKESESDDPEETWASEYRAPPESADVAWSMFADAVERAFQTKRLRAKSISNDSQGWHLVADSDQGPLEGHLSRDGRLVSMKKIGVEF